ncbi:MAG: tetratricopeptide repeat protein [Chloroflexota bacterium]|nr:tetratricopeptide repeat protein [Chloroflexota bacterium]
MAIAAFDRNVGTDYHHSMLIKLLNLSRPPALILLVLLIMAAGCGDAKPTATATATATPRPGQNSGATSVSSREDGGEAASDAGETAYPEPADDLPPTTEPTNTATPSATASPSPTITPRPTSTPTGTPTLTPTATLPANQRLSEARALHDMGNYGAARQAYANLLRDRPDDPQIYEARWRLGQAYLEDDLPTEAIVALEKARAEVPAEQLPPETDFWLARAYTQVVAPQQAIDAYRRYLAQDDTLAGPVHLRIARLMRSTGDDEGAIDAYQQAIAQAPDNFVLFAAREELAEVYAEKESWQNALAQLDQIIAQSQYDRYKAEIQFRAGQILENAGEPEAAASRYRQAIEESERSGVTVSAINQLDLLSQPVDEYTRARLLLANGYVSAGIPAMYEYFEKTPEHAAYPHVLVAEAYYGQREYESALAEWQGLLDTHPEYPDRAGVLIRMATAQYRLDRDEVARDLYAQAAEASSVRAPEALLEAAQIAERSHDCETAATEYLDIVRQYPASAQAGEALYRGGLCQYRLGQTGSAVESWQRLIDSYPGNTYAHAGRFWLGKGQLELGETDAAIETWQGLRPVAPDSYYTARAAELAAQAGVDGPLQKTSSSNADEESLQEEADAWLANWAAPGVSDPATLRQLPAELAVDKQLQRGATYLRAGLRAEAIRELDAVRDRYKNDPLAMYALSLYFRDLGAYRHATLAGVRLGALAPDGLFESPEFVQRLAYPNYFADMVEAEGSAFEVDPLLMYALIRQESFFERGARSSAAAQGLTQVIPSTAEWIASALGWSGFQASDIYKPYINIKFGTYYLSAALDMFDGNPYAALVGYNAGPGNARYFLDEANTDDHDLFVEEVTIAEPKLYVRRVLAHYANYRRLYGDGGGQ